MPRNQQGVGQDSPREAHVAVDGSLSQIWQKLPWDKYFFFSKNSKIQASL